MATQAEWGADVSPKGDHPGFVEVVDERTILIPERNGNQFAQGLRNILSDPRVGIMVMRPATDEVLRICGRATIHDDADLCERLSARGKPALLVIRVEIDRAAFHCVRAARRAGLWQPDTWDKAGSISFGRIYAEAVGAPEVRELFDRMTDESNAKL